MNEFHNLKIRTWILDEVQGLIPLEIEQKPKAKDETIWKKERMSTNLQIAAVLLLKCKGG